MPITRTLLAIAVASLVAGCSASANVEKVPVGTKVELTRQDGGVVQGTLVARDAESLKIDTGPVTRSVPRDRIAHIAVADGTKAVKLPPVAKFREYTIPAGRTLSLRLETAVNSATARVEDPVEATVVEPIVIGGTEVVPAGSTVRGEVRSATASGKVKGRASLALRFTSLTIPEVGDRYQIVADFEQVAASSKKDDAQKIGIPAAGGAIVGAIIGGKKGAAVGAVVGGGAGAAAVLATPGREITLPRGTRLEVPLVDSIDIKIPIKSL